MGKRICVVGCDLGPGPMNYLREQFPEFEFLGYPRNAKVPDEVLASAEVLMNYGDKSQIAPAKNVNTSIPSPPALTATSMRWTAATAAVCPSPTARAFMPTRWASTSSRC